MPTRKVAGLAIGRSIDVRLTLAALRSALGYLSPQQFEDQHAQLKVKPAA